MRREDFTAYADICFREFGDRVKYWTTLAEPNTIGVGSYDTGLWPPTHCSNPFGVINCTVGNSTVEPYIVVHNLLLAHASVYYLYHNTYHVIFSSGLFKYF
jgi:beta-glucosidase